MNMALAMNETNMAERWTSDHINKSNLSIYYDSRFLTYPLEDIYRLLNISNGSNVNIQERDSLYILIPVTILYVMILIAGIIGNVSTCIVIARNKGMHTATNYYLFSLAVSDLLLVISGIPSETYKIWYPYEYIFGEAFCILHGFASEISANATVLTITAFTIERYIAICHPFLSHTMSKLSRAVKFIVAIWITALCLAVPQAIQFGVVVDIHSTLCTIKYSMVEHAFEISGFVFFVGPMTVITVLYMLIGLKLRRSRILQVIRRESCSTGTAMDHKTHKQGSQARVIRMLVAVTVAFFLCWAPFHAQRMMAVYAQGMTDHSETFIAIYNTLTYVSGVLYFLSTCVNPLLYNIMSNKFREAFKSTFATTCGYKKHGITRRPTYSALSRNGTSQRQSTLLRSALTEDVNLYRISENGKVTVPLNTVYKPKPLEKQAAFRSRGYSESSQATIVTSLTGEGNNNSNLSQNQTKRNSRRINRSISGIMENIPSVHTNNTSPVSSFAERLRKGTRSIFKGGVDDCLKTAEKQTKPNRTLKTSNSVESANTNTISNSSLKDYDREEFDGSELSTYMGVLNQDTRNIRVM